LAVLEIVGVTYRLTALGSRTSGCEYLVRAGEISR